MDIEELHKQSAETRKKISKSMSGENNPAYKDGNRSYREKVGAKKGDLVHHKDGDRSNNSKSNLEIIHKKDRHKHDEHHHRENNFHK